MRKIEVEISSFVPGNGRKFSPLMLRLLVFLENKVLEYAASDKDCPSLKTGANPKKEPSSTLVLLLNRS